MTENEGCKEVDDVSTARAQRHRQLVKEDEEGDWSQRVQLYSSQFLEDDVEEANM